MAGEPRPTCSGDNPREESDRQLNRPRPRPDTGGLHDVFEDQNLMLVMAVLLIFHLINYTNFDPCTC